MIRFRFILILVLFSALDVAAQEGVLPLEHFILTRAEIGMKDKAEGVHTALKPFSFWTIQENLPEPDSIISYEQFAFKRENKNYLRLTPRIGLSTYAHGGSNQKLGMASFGGLGLGVGFKNVIYIHADLVVGYFNPPDYLTSITDSLNAYPGMGLAARSNAFSEGYDVVQNGLVMAIKPSKNFELFAGRGRHFIGEGYRSMFLSDFASNYNFARIDMNVWRIKYMVLYTQMDQTHNYPLSTYPTRKKYSTMHYLSMNLTKWWTLGAFEAVVWESEDSVVDRNFDIHYLNPAIFFRPVEYGMGSSDNSLIGFSSSVRPASGLTFYGQVLLDEFLFRDWVAPIQIKLTGDSTIRTGYFGNKQAYQLGIKYHEPLGVKWLSVLAEINAVRPFTYGHSNATQNYTHLNQSLAHPLGANFLEWLSVISWQPNRWKIGLFSSYARKGYSNNLGFLGDDPLVSHTERDMNNREYGNFWLQGRRVDVANIRLVMGYTLIEQWNLRAEAALQYRLERSVQGNSDMLFVGFGIKTALWNDERNL